MNILIDLSGVKPETVEEWCQQNCNGDYRISTMHTGLDSNHQFIQEVQLTDESDGVAFKLRFG